MDPLVALPCLPPCKDTVLLPLEGHSHVALSCKQRAALTRHKCWHLDCNYEKQISVVYKVPRLWLVVTAQTDQHRAGLRFPVSAEINCYKLGD